MQVAYVGVGSISKQIKQRDVWASVATAHSSSHRPCMQMHCSSSCTWLDGHASSFLLLGHEGCPFTSQGCLMLQRTGCCLSVWPSGPVSVCVCVQVGNRTLWELLEWEILFFSLVFQLILCQQQDTSLPWTKIKFSTVSPHVQEMISQSLQIIIIIYRAIKIHPLN